MSVIEKQRKMDFIKNCVEYIMLKTKDMDEKELEELYLQLVGVQLKISRKRISS